MSMLDRLAQERLRARSRFDWKGSTLDWQRLHGTRALTPIRTALEGVARHLPPTTEISIAAIGTDVETYAALSVRVATRYYEVHSTAPFRFELRAIRRPYSLGYHEAADTTFASTPDQVIDLLLVLLADRLEYERILADALK